LDFGEGFSAEMTFKLTLMVRSFPEEGMGKFISSNFWHVQRPCDKGYFSLLKELKFGLFFQLGWEVMDEKRETKMKSQEVSTSQTMQDIITVLGILVLF
jgi:hypothetical protein